MIFLKKLKTHIRIKKRLKFVNKIFAEQTLEEYQKYDMLKLLDCINNLSKNDLIMVYPK